MKYSLVEIRRNYSTRRFSDPPVFSEIEGDRKVGKEKPHPCGFYYYPSETDPAIALGKLKMAITASIKKDIKNLQEDLRDLDALTIPTKKKSKK